MKARRLFRPAALLLAILLAVCALLPGSAEQEGVRTEEMTLELWQQWVESLEGSFASMTVEQQYAYLLSLDDEAAVQALLAVLTEEQLAALMEYAAAQTPQIPTPDAVNSTHAGPFLSPVYVGGRLRSAMLTSVPADNGLELSKTAVTDPNGYKIRLEAYTKGKVTTTTTGIPADIVLVLDQSLSMNYDFGGGMTRQAAMKSAVNNFIDAVALQYGTANDHRIAIVKFSTTANTVRGWTNVNAAGATSLHTAVNGMNPDGYTNTAAGMGEAEVLMGSGYSYAGSNPTRHKVVVLFTDGIPTQSPSVDFNTEVANGALASAKRLKSANVTVFAVGIFPGANPERLYGLSSDGYTTGGAAAGQVDYWWRSYESNPDATPPAGNRFLNYLSSNFMEAQNLGLTRDTGREWSWSKLKYESYEEYKITSNATRSYSNYYLTAGTPGGLNAVFQSITQQIETHFIDLGSGAKLKDIVSPFFTLPDNTQVKVFTSAYDGSGFGADQPATGITVTVESGVLIATGFDFNANFVSTELKADGTHGKKLVIEFVVGVRPGFLGGNKVPTNDDDSGVYPPTGDIVEAFPEPTVDVPIPAITVSAPDKNIYLLGGATEDQLLGGATATTANSVEIKMDEPNFGLQPWQNAFVNITHLFTPGTYPLTNQVADSAHTLTVNIAPINTGTYSAVSGSDSLSVFVFKPELTFKDSNVDYRSAEPAQAAYAAINRVPGVVWKHDTTVLEPGIAMLGSEPTLLLTYAPISGIEGGIVTSTTNVPVAVTVRIGAADVTAYTSFVHIACVPACEWGGAGIDPAARFLLHVVRLTGSLTISKSGAWDIDEYQSFLFRVVGTDAFTSGVNLTVAVVGNHSVTLANLPVGTYSVTEITDWSWRYEPTVGAKNATVPGGGTVETSFANSRDKDKWLSGDCYAENVFN